MKTELGKWLMDIAKYIATAVVLTTIFGEIGSEVTLAVLGRNGSLDVSWWSFPNLY